MEAVRDRADASARTPSTKRARIAGTIFAVVALSIWVGGHVYMARALVLSLHAPRPLEHLGITILTVLAAALVLQPIAEWRLGPRAVRPLTWVASVWMGLAFFLVLLLLLSAPFAAIASASSWLGPPEARVRAAVVVVGAVALAGYAFASGWRSPIVTRREVALERLPRGLDGFRIVQISDIHIGPLLDRSFASDLVHRVGRLEPDLIAVTGDLVDGSVDRLRDEVAPFGELAAPHGVWFVTGNHDYYSGVVEWTDQLRRLGIRVLENERVAIETQGGCFELAGVNDRMGALFGAEHASDLETALRGWQGERALVLLAHDPTTFHQAWRHGIDLQISGHTHGGQLWPIGLLVKLFVGYVAGPYRRGDSQLLVSCGSGFWGPPMRFGAPPEITEIVLRSAAPAP
jgi:uncharacterized protein